MPGYLRTRFGQMDLAIVILTAPWFLIPGLFNTRYLGLLRLIRLTRLLVVSRRQRVLAGQLNRVGIFVVLLVAACAFIVQRSDGPADGFDNYGDGLWWAIVTLTTVGYGDLVPTSTVGRLTGALLMISGIARPRRARRRARVVLPAHPATRPPPWARRRRTASPPRSPPLGAGRGAQPPSGGAGRAAAAGAVSSMRTVGPSSPQTVNPAFS